MPLSCRFYKHKFPEVEDCVMVNVGDIQEMGAYVSLLEYNQIQGMILLSELSRRRIRSINKLLRVGRNECVIVIRVDQEKGYIDLSKRRATKEEETDCIEKFSKGKVVNQILRHTAELAKFESNEQLEELYEKTAWYFDEKYCKGASFDVFKKMVTNPELLDECNLEPNIKLILLENIQHRLTPQQVKIRTDVDVACYDYEGVDAVKAALREGLALTCDELPIKINLIAPPTYVMTVTTSNRQEGVDKLNMAIDRIRQKIESNDGVFRVKMAPKVVTQTDENLLADQFHKLELTNREVAGDDDPEDAIAEENEIEESGEVA